jgi:hypothetical protein
VVVAVVVMVVVVVGTVDGDPSAQSRFLKMGWIGIALHADLLPLYKTAEAAAAAAAVEAAAAAAASLGLTRELAAAMPRLRRPGTIPQQLGRMEQLLLLVLLPLPLRLLRS